MPRVDLFETWNKNKTLDERLNTITSMVSKRSTQLMISQSLGITSKTFITVRDNHQEIKDAIAKGEDMLKSNIIDAIYKRAVGFETENEVEDDVTILEIVNGRRIKE